MKHISMHVTGRVQGVFFRASTKAKADELGVKGFVRNENDGSVYIEAESEEPVLQQFTAWCRQGPRNAHVDQVNIAEMEFTGFKDFIIQH